jgi:hypothetical protein
MKHMTARSTIGSVAYAFLCALFSIAALILGFAVFVGTSPGQAAGGGKAATPFPSQQFKDVKWLDSLAKGIEEAGAAKKPICLILAGQRPSGDC